MAKIQEKPTEEAKEFNSEPQKMHGGLTENNLWTGTRSNKSPHKLGFYMMTISVNTTLFPTVNSCILFNNFPLG